MANTATYAQFTANICTDNRFIVHIEAQLHKKTCMKRGSNSTVCADGLMTVS